MKFKVDLMTWLLWMAPGMRRPALTMQAMGCAKGDSRKTQLANEDSPLRGPSSEALLGRCSSRTHV